MWNSIFFIALLLLPMQFALSRVPGFDVASGRVIIVGIFFMWLFTGLKNRSVRFPSHISFWLPILFLSLSALSLIGAQQLGWGVRKWLFLANMFLWIVVSLSLLAQKKISITGLSRALAWAGGIAASVGILQFSLQYILGLEASLDLWRTYVAPFFLGGEFSQAVNEFPSWLVGLGGETIFRAVGFFPDPHMLAFFLELTLPWALFLALQKKAPLYWVFTLLIVVGLLLTFSRGAYMGLFIGGGAASAWILWAKKSITGTHIVTAVSLGIVLLGALFIAENPIRERLLASSPLADTSTEGRLFLWSHAWGETLKQPLLGTGLGNYLTTLEPSAPYRSPITVHNTYLDIAVEMGMPALFVWIFMLGAGIWGYARGFTRENMLYGAGLVALSMHSVHAFFDTALYSAHAMPVWCTLIAMGMAAQSKVRKSIK